MEVFIRRSNIMDMAVFIRGSHIMIWKCSLISHYSLSRDIETLTE